tara:strand:+ start:82 stop:366 length:285 start_codon:yes stop_codon:yes gene_type:complete
MFCACETFDMDNEETVCVDKPTICAPVCSKNETIVGIDSGLEISAGKYAGKYAGQIRNYLYLIENCDTKERYYHSGFPSRFRYHIINDIFPSKI